MKICVRNIVTVQYALVLNLAPFHWRKRDSFSLSFSFFSVEDMGFIPALILILILILFSGGYGIHSPSLSHSFQWRIRDSFSLSFSFCSVEDMVFIPALILFLILFSGG
jgi:hypothetical protein